MPTPLVTDSVEDPFKSGYGYFYRSRINFFFFFYGSFDQKGASYRLIADPDSAFLKGSGQNPRILVETGIF